MKSSTRSLALLSVLVLSLGMELAWTAAPSQLILSSKVRDFNEEPDGNTNGNSTYPHHPDFNTFGGCQDVGYVDQNILLTGKTDPSFPNDNRNPHKTLKYYSSGGSHCFTDTTHFNQWYNDDIVSINRPFLVNLVFDTVPGQPGIYSYKNNAFFPIDNINFTNGLVDTIIGGPKTSFGQNSNGNTNHNFGFTMEFHATFTYLKEILTGPSKRAAQNFHFTGDDDVWVFINGQLAIDLGGLHSAQSQGITLDSIQALKFGLVDKKSYFLDFFIAERHVSASNCEITTSLQLETEKLPKPIVTGKTSFNDSTILTLSDTVTSGTTFYYTTDGSIPDSANTTTTKKYTGPITVYNSNTLNFIAYNPDYKPSDVLTVVLTKNAYTSTIQILQANGQPLTNGYLTDTNKTYLVKLITTQLIPKTANIDEKVPAADDQETLVLSNPASVPGTIIGEIFYQGSAPLSITAATKNNSITESKDWDSLFVTWINPKIPTDIAQKRVLIRPAPKPAIAYFTSSTNPTDTIKEYPLNTTTIYFIIKDQVAKPLTSYTAVVSSSQYGIDSEAVNLTLVPGSNNTFIGKITIDNNAKSPADGKLQISLLGDQLTVVYRDPVDPSDIATGSAGFAQSIQEKGEVHFTNATFATPIGGTLIPPSSGKLFISYTDDYAQGKILTKTATLTLVNKKYGGVIGTDHETITLNLTGGPNGTKATWTGSINLSDVFPSKDSNSVAETHFLGKATISVTTHNNVGASDGTAVIDTLTIANADSVATLAWKLSDPTPKNPEGLIFTVKDQSYTSSLDTALISVGCTKSGDSVSNFGSTESLPTSGLYTSGILTKDEGVPNFADPILSCLTTDQIRVRYVDPVYGTLTELLINEVLKPVATPPGQEFVTGVSVTITSTPGATIYYTLEGSIPTPGAATTFIFTDPIHISNNTTLKAIATLPGYKDSKVMTEVYTKKSIASKLEILDQNGNQISDKTITGTTKSLHIKLITTQDNLFSAKANSTTSQAGDAETLTLGSFKFLGNAFEYSQDIAFLSPGAKNSGDFTIEAKGTDTLIVTWTNPFLPTDKASDTVFVKPAFVAAQVYFSTTEGGIPLTGFYPISQDSIFIVVKTRAKDPALTYTVNVTTSNAGDQETLTLKELTPGVFSAKAPVSKTVKAADGKIQVAVSGDQLTAIFVDPVYQTSYRGDAGFAQDVEESATLDFIDSAGNVVAPTDIWNPNKGKVYLRYSDDWNAGIATAVQTQRVRLNLINKKSGVAIGTDSETVVLTLKGSPAGTRGTWEGSLTLVDKSSAKKGNDSLETYFRGELSATITPHNNAGTIGGTDVTDNLVIAYPNEPANIIIQDTANKTVVRATSKVNITIHDQLFSKSGDASIEASVSCTQSGDKVSKVTLVWDGKQYVIQPPLSKGELTGTNVDKSDALLLCLDADKLMVTYIDPVYLDERSADVTWNDPTIAKFYFESSKDFALINSALDGKDKDFVVVVEGKSPTPDKIDTILVTLTTAQGEKETVKAIETGPISGKFIATVPFKFSSDDPKGNNGIVDAKIALGNKVNQVLVSGEVTIAGATLKADISLISNYDLVSKAYAKDENQDGKVDHVYFVFDHKLLSLPTGIDSVYWNKVSGNYSQKAEVGQLSFVPGTDSSVVVADFSNNQFGANLTSIPEGQTPYAHFQNDNVYGGQRPAIQDSVGAVIVSAIKLPSSLFSVDVSSTEKRFAPDTLTITVSEKLKTTVGSFNQILRFTKGCEDFSNSLPVNTYSEPTVSSDGLTWTIIVDNTPDAQTPLVGDCIFLDISGKYVDLQGNTPAKLGVPLTGENPKLTIREFQGYPPVAGLDPQSPGFVVVNNDNRSDTKGTFSNQNNNGTWNIVWIPPFGYDANDPIGSLQRVADQFNDQTSTTDRKREVATPKSLPTGSTALSTVKVVTSGSYKAHISIFDNLGHFVREMDQAYGLNGEDKNPYRATDKGQMSFLVWDMKDQNSQRAGQGVYVWKVSFVFLEKNKKSEVMITRTGVLRN